MDLPPAARDFQKLNPIIAHFGAAYFRESLMVCYHGASVHLDTSGSNAWMRHTGQPWDEVSGRALQAAGRP